MTPTSRCLSFLLLLLVFACSEQPESALEGQDLASSIADRNALTVVPHVAWMSRELPPEAVGYFRLPLLWDALSEPSGDALNNVKASAAHQAQLAKIRQGLLDNVWTQLPTPAVAPARLLMQTIRSPLEVVATLPPDGSLAPNFLIGTTLKLADGQSFDNVLDELLDLHPQLRRLSPADDQGITTLLAGPLPVYVHFDDAADRLRMFTGASATIAYFRERVTAQPTENPVATWEQPRDQSGRGLSLWMDLERLWPQVSPMVPEENRVLLEALGVNAIEGLHIARVARDGHGQLLVDLKMPEEGFRKFLPRPSAPVSLTASGSPELLVRLALPSDEEVDQALAQIRSTVPDTSEFDEGLAEVSDAIEEALGVAPGIILRAFGPQYLYVVDDAGTWGGYQVRDSGARDELLSAMAKASDSQMETRSAGGRDYSYWRFRSPWNFGDEITDATNSPGMLLALSILDRLAVHLFWQEQEGHMVAASVPQVLMARDRLGADTDLGQWLEDGIGVNPDNSVLLIARSHTRGAQGLYHFYLEALLMLADLADVTIDPFELPLWQDAAPGNPGGIALGLDSTAEGLTAHLTFQASPLETLQGTETLVMVYAVGILAAVAVPAYQDYEQRAKVMAANISIGAHQLAIAEHLASQGSFPEDLDAFELPQLGAGTSVSYDGESGELTVTFDETNAGDLAFGDVRFLPSVDASGYVEWQCYSDTLPQKLLPATCRY